MVAGRLQGVRDKALAGDYAGANRDFAAGWSPRWTQTYHPAYELRIATPGMTTANDHGRVTDFRTGEVATSWTDSHGTRTRRAFVSRAERVIVYELTSASGRTIDATLSVNTAVDTDYTALRSRHTRIRTAWYDRSRLDLGVSAADRALAVSQLITRQDNALAECSWPSLGDNYNHRHVHHMYGAWPLTRSIPTPARAGRTRYGHWPPPA